MRAAALLAVTASLALASSACVSETPFICTDSAQCIDSSGAGTCESTGFCSFEDAECETGRRYGKAAGEGLADQCVEGTAGCAGNLTLTAGGSHTCAFDSTGAVTCWGADSNGQLGDGNDLRDQSSPQPVTLVPAVSQMASGRAHTCAVTRDNGLYCWGDNSDGQLGVSGAIHALPVAVATDVAQVAAGGDTTCFVTVDGLAACLGDNFSGEVGNNTLVDATTPDFLEELVDVVAVAVGGSHSCALISNGSVQCWGANASGQLGDGTLDAKLVPNPVPGLTAVAELALGNSHSCARLETGTVSCWGENASGQLADGTALPRSEPTVVNNVAGAERILASGSHTCALAGGLLSCWGENGSGQLGDTTKDDRSAPVPLTVAVADTASVALGGGHSCAQNDAGALLCWGSDVSGQLGLDSLMRSAVPVQANGVTGAAQVATGDGHTCVVLASGAVQCWGEANDGELGTGSTSRIDIGPGDTESVAAADSIVAAGDRTCVHETNDTVSCWGGISNGLLGAGSTSDRTTPGSISALVVSPTGVTVSSEHTCATTLAGEVFCWGLNSSGEQGNGNTTSSASARASTAATMPSLLAAGDGHSCALDMANTTLCWGAGTAGELGDGTSTTTGSGAAVTVAIATPTAFALGDNHSCALLTDQTVSCWGRNAKGQTGNGAATSSEPLPVTVSGLAGVAEIATDEDFTCARLADGTVWCWGENDEGEVGGGSEELFHSTPVQVTGINAISISAGSDHACAVAADNTVWCWGDNSDAQLDGRQVRFLEPTATTLTCQ